MKNIFASTFLLCFAFAANAQVKQNLLQNQLNGYKLQPLQVDTTGGNLMPRVKPNAPGNFFNMPQTGVLLASIPGLAEEQKIYTRMPVKHLHSDDRMPIAHMDAAGAVMSIKRVTIIDPLKSVLPVAP